MEDKKNNPIFVIGVAHSGTTILYRMLAKHPELCWFSQYSMRGGEVPSRFRLPFYNAINRLGNKIFGITWKKRFGIYEKVIPSPSEPHKIWKYLLPDDKRFYTEDDFDKRQAEKMRQLVRKECKAWRKPRLITKLPRLVRDVRLLKRVFPEAHFVHIVRDGKAVALSNKHKFARHTDSNEKALKGAAQDWKEIVNYIDEQSEYLGSQLTEITYEDLCGDVHEVLKHVIVRAGLDPERFAFSAIPETLSVTNFKHFRKADVAEKKLLNKTLKGALKRYNYSLFSV